MVGELDGAPRRQVGQQLRQYRLALDQGQPPQVSTV